MEVPAPTGLGHGQPEDPLGRATVDGGRVRRGGGMRGTDSNFTCSNRFQCTKVSAWFGKKKIFLPFRYGNVCELKNNA